MEETTKVPGQHKIHFRTLILSDLHLGTKDAQARELLDVLRGIRCDKLILNGVSASQVSFVRNGQHVKLVIAPSTAGRRDGGSVSLGNLDPYDDRGIESIVLADAAWTLDDVRRKTVPLGTAGADTLTLLTWLNPAPF